MLIAICGIDGSGKTTQLHLLEKSLSENYEVYLTKQPTDFYRSYERFRKYVNGQIDKNEKILYELALLSAADRMLHYNQEITANQDKIIICDRYVYSGYAYFLSRGLEDIEWLKIINKEILKPDFTFYLDIPPEIALKRIIEREGKSNKKEETDLELMNRVRNYFINQPWGKDENYYVMDARNEKNELHDKIMKIINKQLYHPFRQ